MKVQQRKTNERIRHHILLTIVISLRLHYQPKLYTTNDNVTCVGVGEKIHVRIAILILYGPGSIHKLQKETTRLSVLPQASVHRAAANLTVN